MVWLQICWQNEPQDFYSWLSKVFLSLLITLTERTFTNRHKVSSNQLLVPDVFKETNRSQFPLKLAQLFGWCKENNIIRTSQTSVTSRDRRQTIHSKKRTMIYLTSLKMWWSTHIQRQIKDKGYKNKSKSKIHTFTKWLYNMHTKLIKTFKTQTTLLWRCTPDATHKCHCVEKDATSSRTRVSTCQC